VRGKRWKEGKGVERGERRKGKKEGKRGSGRRYNVTLA
jgi:hypothetical protein